MNSRFSEPTALGAAPPDPEIPLGDPHWLEKLCAKYGVLYNGERLRLDPAAWGVTPTVQHQGQG